jgi:hypothetical protein
LDGISPRKRGIFSISQSRSIRGISPRIDKEKVDKNVDNDHADKVISKVIDKNVDNDHADKGDLFGRPGSSRIFDPTIQRVRRQTLCT